tara:strand:- start:3444 stop:9977 length:6534 start_codon:yes stop_codon:yes gene_type:complete
MSQEQKQVIEINEPKVIKAIQKPFTRQIIECFYNTPLSASEVAEAVSFPKDKIYYHIKKLISIDILFIAESKIINGIEQHKYLPVAKQIKIGDLKIGQNNLEEDKNETKEFDIKNENYDEQYDHQKDNNEISDQKLETNNPLLEKLLNKRLIKEKKIPKNEISISDSTLEKIPDKSSGTSSFKRIIDDRRRRSDRRTEQIRRNRDDRRKKQILDYGEKDRRKNKDRRSGKENRKQKSRREAKDRRLDVKTVPFLQELPAKLEEEKKASKQSLFKNNAKLHLDGVTNSISFVHTGQNVTFMQADLGIEHFQIKQIMNYRLPIINGNEEIKTLPDLITNVYEQFIDKGQQKSIYLAIHSDGYQYEMTYVNTEDHKKSDFKDFLLYTLTKSYSLDTEKSLVAYDFNNKNENNAVVCYSPFKEYIENDYNTLIDSGLQPRYNTSIPQILNNLYNYYKPQTGAGNALIIYIGQTKTHMVLFQSFQLVDSRDFSIGLDHFMNPLCKMSNPDETAEEDIRNKAMDFLDRYGIAMPETKPSELNLFPWDESQTILNRIGEKLQKEIKSSKTYFINVRETMGQKKMKLSEIYLGGPGSHIKNIDKLVNQSLESPVNKLEILNTASLKNIGSSKTDFLSKIKEKNIERKKKNTENILDEVRNNIMGHKKAIETATSPESVKYRLARMEIDKNSKIKSIKEATEKLIKTATDFKELKDDYTGTQETLTADFETVTTQLDKKSEELLEKYQEHEYLVKQISRMEYESDQFQKKRDEARKESKGDYSLELKKSANIRVSLAEQKNELEKMISDKQIQILKNQENLNSISMRFEEEQDEIAVLEYLFQTIDNASSAVRKSFITQLQYLDRLRKKDYSEIEQAEYLLTLNMQRLNNIRKTYSKIVSEGSQLDSHSVLERGNEFETKKKLITVLDGLLEMPENLDQLKKITIDLIKINDDYKELINRKNKLQKKIESKSRHTDKEERRLSILKKDIDIFSNKLKKEEIQHQKTLEAMDHIQEAILEIDPLITKNDIKRKLEHKLQKSRRELNSFQNQVIRIESAILVRKQKVKELKKNHTEQKNNHKLRLKKLNSRNRKIILNQEKLKKILPVQIQKDKDITKKIKEKNKEYSQFKKSLKDVSEKHKKLKTQETILVNEAKKEKNKLQKIFNRKLKELEKDENKKSILANKKRQQKENAYTKDLSVFKRKEKSVQDLMDGSISEINRIQNDCAKAKENLSIKRKKINPKISDLKKQIKGWSRDLKRIDSIQQKFDDLEEQHIDWQELLEKETEKKDEQIRTLEGHIAHKKSDSYLLLVQEGLTRFNSETGAVEAARNLAKESIDMDQEQMKDIMKTFKRLEKQHQTFMKRYKINRKKILIEFKPYKGREKTIHSRIDSAQRKILSAEKSIQFWQDKFDQKNDLLIKMEVDFLKLQGKADQKINDIELKIDHAKKNAEREQEIISSELEGQLAIILEKKNTLENKYLTDVQNIDDNLGKDEIIVNRKKLKSKILSIETQLNISQNHLKKLTQQKKKIDRIITVSQRDLKLNHRKLAMIKIHLKEEEERFKSNIKQFTDQLEILKKDEEEKKENQLTINRKKHDEELNLRKLKKEFDEEEYESQKLQKKILILIQKTKNLTSATNQKHTLAKKILNEKKQRQILLRMEEKFSIRVSYLEKSMQKLNKAIDTQNDERSKTIKTIDELKHELDVLKNDLDKTNTLQVNNRENLSVIGNPQLEVLESLNQIKELFPVTKSMLNEFIDSLYDLIDQETKQKKELDIKIRDMEEDLKSWKVDLTILEKELIKINKNMKRVLEYSVYEQDLTPKAIEISRDDTEYKLRSYMDLAELKARSKDLFEEIIQAEQDIARLQKKSASVEHVQKETEQINQRKIKRMEDDCTKLELKIAKEKNELEELEKSLKDLQEHTSSYSERIEVLEEELKKFREKETKNELLLRDLDRSLEKIHKTAEEMVFEKPKIRENTIELDYMANLGLLMNTDSELNLLPESHKKEYRFFGINRILQNMLIIMIAVFSLTAYAQRGKIEPLEASLPNKYSELSLLNVRQDVKQVLEKQVMVADAFQVLIDEDKALSSNMVTTLKYLSNAVPDNFKVTSLILDKELSSYVIDDTLSNDDNLMFIISLDGFYSLGKEKASNMAQSFKNVLDSSNTFKAVYFSPGKVVNKWKTSFSISLVL